MSDLRMIEFEMEDGSKAIWNMDHVMTIRKHDDNHVAIFDSKGDKHIANVTYNELHHVVSDSFPHPHRSQEDFEATERLSPMPCSGNVAVVDSTSDGSPETPGRVPRSRVAHRDRQASSGVVGIPREVTRSQYHREYRAPLIERDDLSLTVVESPEHEVPARVIDASLGGVSVFIDRADSSNHTIGDKVLLRLVSRHLPSSMVVHAQVQHETEIPAGYCYSFCFEDWDGLVPRLPPELVTIFNQRHCYRVEADPANPIALEVRGITAPFQAETTAIDISTSGLSFRTALEAEASLPVGTAIEVSLALPSSSEALTFGARVRHRDLDGESFVYGVDFHEGSTRCFEEKLRAVAKYVTIRMLEPLGVKVT